MIYIGGVPRSGTTFAFNVARIGFSLRHRRMPAVRVQGEENPCADIVKVHHFSPEDLNNIKSGSKLIWTHRDENEAVESLAFTFRMNPRTAARMVLGSIQHQEFARDHGLFLCFEEILNDRVGCVKRILKHLDLWTGGKDYADICDQTTLKQAIQASELVPNGSLYCPDTLYYKNHMRRAAQCLAG